MNRYTVIVTLQWICRILLAGVLILAGYLKLQDSSALMETVATITWLPVWLKWRIVELLPWVEILTGILLLIRLKERWVVSLVSLIFLGFLGFAIYGFATGMEGDCGCFGELADSTFGWKMIFRNGFFATMALFLFYRPVNPS
ncbi:MAG: MauE/DoxX family redox-associated membrane protein [Balneolaceae bacterium]